MQDNVTPLYSAVTWGHVAIMRLLLERRADPNLCVKVCTVNHAFGAIINGFALGLANGIVASWRLSLVASLRPLTVIFNELLVSSFYQSWRCSISLQDGFSVLNSASLNGCTEMVDLLVQAGADIHLASSDVSITL